MHEHFTLALAVFAWSLTVSASPILSSSSGSTVSSASNAASPSPSRAGSPNPPSSTMPLVPAMTQFPDLLPPAVQLQLSAALNDISAGSSDRWVTSHPIEITDIGSSNSSDSNKGLAARVDHAFTSNPANASVNGWVDTYLQFLIEAGGTNSTNQTALLNNYTATETAFAKAQVKLVNAYENANANYTYIGINIYNTSRIDPLSLAVIEAWGAQARGNGSYTQDDFAAYVQLNKSYVDLEAQFMNLQQEQKMAIEGYQYKISLNMGPPVFNLSMDVGADVVVPAWGATIINNTVITPSVIQGIPANLTANATLSSASTSAVSTSIVHQTGTAAAPSISVKTSHAARATASSKANRALGVIKAVAKNSTLNNDSPHLSSISITAASSTNVALPSGTLSPGIKGVVPSSSSPVGGTVSGPGPKGNFMFLGVTPGSWAGNLAANIAYARTAKPDVFEKYFGKDSSGDGPIGRIWTHICVMTTDDPDAAGLTSVQVLGMVWDVLPALKS